MLEPIDALLSAAFQQWCPWGLAALHADQTQCQHHHLSGDRHVGQVDVSECGGAVVQSLEPVASCCTH